MRYPPRPKAPPLPKDRRYILTDEQEALYRRSTRFITPSTYGSEHWEGDWREGETFSVRQMRELATMGIDPATVDRLDVIAAGDPRRIYIGTQVYFYRRLTCPIVGKRGDRVMVISPAGHRKLVYSDGSQSRSKTRG